MVSILVIVYEHPLAATVRLPKLVRQVPHKWIDARHPDWDTSGAPQIEAAGSCDCFQITSQPEFNFRNSSFTAVRRSGGIDSAHAGVSNKPRATNAAKHGWIQTIAASAVTATRVLVTNRKQATRMAP
jgi:hypothetical protein